MTLITTIPAFEVQQIGGRIGAEISGLDLSRPLPEETVDQLKQALYHHKALFFRGQHLDDDGQQRFVRHFGPLTRAHPTLPPGGDQPNVLVVSGPEGTRSNNWHTDVTFLVTPPQLTTLRAIAVPPYGGETVIANEEAAYADLPEPLRILADHLWAVHTNDYDYVQASPSAGADDGVIARRRAQFVSRTWETAHPVVRVHPETGERSLFIGGFAQRLVGLSRGESRDILRLLQAYVLRPENQVRWRWEVGDLVLFDNRNTQHYAPDDYGTELRELRRVTAAGPLPVGVDGRTSWIVSGDDGAHYTPAPD